MFHRLLVILCNFLVINFVILQMSDYYERRLLNFANFRLTSHELFFEKILEKAESVEADKIELIGEDLYLVPSETDASTFYEVNAVCGVCSCSVGIMGRFCKHQAALFKYRMVELPNMPAVTAEDRYRMAEVALGDRVESRSFYQPLQAAQAEVGYT